MIEHIRTIYATEGENLIYDVPSGIYGPSDIDTIHRMCEQIGLSKKDRFLDLGSGDGRVVIVASLFCDATGIEADASLVKKSRNINKKLGTAATFICGDFLKHDVSHYDATFIFPDHSFDEGLNEKLQRELKGTLYVYGGAFQPDGMQKGRKIHVGKTVIDTYTKKL